MRGRHSATPRRPSTSRPTGMPTRCTSTRSPIAARTALAALPPERRRDDAHWSSPPTASRSRWPRRRPTRASCASARRWWPSSSASAITASPIRAAAATRAIPGSSPTSARSCAQEASRGTRELLVVPIGFVCDHVEVLYDLDVEARQIADAAGIGFTRAETVNDHPSFVRMLAAVVGRTGRGMTAPRRVAVIGGGISGLAAAHRLIELGRDAAHPLAVRLFEAGPRAGRRDSHRARRRLRHRSGARLVPLREAGGAAPLRATRHHRPAGRHARGVPPHLRRPRRPPARAARGVPADGADALLAAAHHAALLLARQAAHGARPRPAARRSAATRASPRSSPAASGAKRWSASPSRWSVASTRPTPSTSAWPRPCRAFWRWSAPTRSVILAMWRQQRAAARRSSDSGARWSLFLSFDRGMQCLVDELTAPSARCARCSSAGPSRGSNACRAASWRLDGAFECDAVVVATPAHAAATLLRPLDAALGDELAAIPYASSATVTLAFDREDIPHPLDGFGFVVPHVERRRLLAGTFSSLKYPGRAPGESVLVRAFVGGALQPELLELDDDSLTAAVRERARRAARRARGAASDPHRPLAARDAAVSGRPHRTRRPHPRPRRRARRSPRRQRLRRGRHPGLHPQRRVGSRGSVAIVHRDPVVPEGGTARPHPTRAPRKRRRACGA